MHTENVPALLRPVPARQARLRGPFADSNSTGLPEPPHASAAASRSLISISSRESAG